MPQPNLDVCSGSGSGLCGGVSISTSLFRLALQLCWASLQHLCLSALRFSLCAIYFCIFANFPS